MLRYFICTTPRSGSTWFCELLSQTHIAGNPSEYYSILNKHFLKYFNMENKKIVALQKYTYQQILQYTKWQEHFQQAENICGCKILWSQMGNILHLGAKAGISEKKILPKDKYIWLIRKNTLFQSISYVRAQISGIWHEYKNNTSIPPPYELQKNIYNYEPHILANYKIFIADNVAWQDYFIRNNLTPLIVYYEDLQENPTQELEKIMIFLDLTFSGKIPETQLKKQSSEQETKQIAHTLLQKYPDFFIANPQKLHI